MTKEKIFKFKINIFKRIKLEIKVEESALSSDATQKKQVSLNNYFSVKNLSPTGTRRSTKATSTAESATKPTAPSPVIDEHVNVKNILRIKNENSNFTCDQCPKAFTLEASLKSHKMFSHPSSKSLSTRASKLTKV